MDYSNGSFTWLLANAESTAIARDRWSNVEVLAAKYFGLDGMQL